MATIGRAFIVAAVLLSSAVGVAEPTIPREHIPSDIDAELSDLLLQLYDRAPAERCRAIDALGERSEDAAITAPFLAAMLHESFGGPSGSGRAAGIVWKQRGKWSFNRPPGAGGTSGHLPGAAAFAALLNLGDQAIPAIVEMLDTDSEHVFSRVRQLLRKFDTTVVRRCLIDGLKHPSRRVRFEALDILASGDLVNDVTIVVPLLKDGCDQVRAKAAQTLGAIGDERAADPLCERLRALRRAQKSPTSTAGRSVARGRHTVVNSRYGRLNELPSVVTALGEVGTDVCVRGLASLCADRHLRDAALKALGESNNPTAIPHLRRIARERPIDAADALAGMDLPEAHTVAHSLVGGAFHPSERVRGRFRGSRKRAARVIARLGREQGMDQLIAALAGEHREAAAYGLAHTNWSRTEETVLRKVIAAMDGPDRSLRRALADMLRGCDEPIAQETLFRLLTDEYSGVRDSAACALGKTRDAAVVDRLVAIADDPSNPACSAARTAMARLAGQPRKLQPGYWAAWWRDHRQEFVESGTPEIPPQREPEQPAP